MFFDLFCVFDSSRLSEKIDLDLAGIFQLALDLLCDLSGEENHFVFGNLIGLDHDSDLAAGLDSVGAFNTVEGVGELFELFKTLDVVFDVFAACTGTGLMKQC